MAQTQLAPTRSPTPHFRPPRHWTAKIVDSTMAEAKTIADWRIDEATNSREPSKSSQEFPSWSTDEAPMIPDTGNTRRPLLLAAKTTTPDTEGARRRLLAAETGATIARRMKAEI